MDKATTRGRLLAARKHQDLVAELARLAVDGTRINRKHVKRLADELHSVSERIRETTVDGCAELLGVSAGLGTMLAMLQECDDASVEDDGLHYLLAALKDKLDRAVNNVQEMF
ncbi:MULTISPECIES: DUF1484 family protein [Cupriavidus]